MTITFPYLSIAQQSNEAEITTEDLINKMNSDSTLVILDVRTKEELTGPLGHIEGIVHIPVNELMQRMDELEKFRNQKIAVICRSGNRSGIAAKILREYNFNAINVKGGMIDYRKKEKTNFTL